MERKGPGPTDPLVRAEPPFDWYRTPTEMPRRVETPARTPITLDPDIALWPVTPLSRWPFIGPPTEGMWPVGWMGVDATGTIYTCTVGGEPGTWAAQGGSSGQVAFTQKGPYRFTFADNAALLAGVDLWTAALGDSPQYIAISIPTTPFDGGTGGSATADSPPTSVPLTIVGGANTFVFTGDGGLGTPETFTIAPGTYATLAAIAAAVMAAPGTISDTFGDHVIVTDDGTELVFTMTTVGLPAFAQTGNTITEGNGGAAAIGINAPPAVFSGGLGPKLGIYINDQLLVGNQNPTDVSRVDAGINYAPLKQTRGQIAAPGEGGLVYIGPDLAGLPYVAKWQSDPGALTVGECWIYALLFPELIHTT